MDMYRPFRITCQGVYLSGKSKLYTQCTHSESEFPQILLREKGMKVPKSLGSDPKPVDLTLSKVKCG